MDWLSEDVEEEKTPQASPWKIAIVDDDEQVHIVTKLSLKHFTFEGRSLEFIGASSGAEAKELFKNHDDIAMVLLDVVMESENAGLQVAKYIREELGNRYTRIVLRTGQPGMAPEDQIIRNYDIDGYKTKTEIKQHTMAHLCYTALRSYRDLNRIKCYQKGLEALIEALNEFNQLDQFECFAQSLLSQICNVINAYDSEFVIRPAEVLSYNVKQGNTWCLKVDQDHVGNCDKIDDEYQQLTNQVLNAKESLIKPPVYALYHLAKQGSESVFVLRTTSALDKQSIKLIELFSKNVCVIVERLLCKENQ